MFANRKLTFLFFLVLEFSLFVPFSLWGQTSGAKGSVKDLDPIGEEKPDGEIKPITEFLPFFGKRVRDMGFDLPLPFGLNLIYTNMRQYAAVSDIRIGEDETPVNDVTLPDPLSKGEMY